MTPHTLNANRNRKKERLSVRNQGSKIGVEVMDKSMSLEMATLTAKGQVTIPKPVRDALGLHQGDQLSWELDDGCVTVRLITPLDLAYLTGIETHLSEWASTADDEAFADL